MALKRTPLYAAHQKRGGRLIEFGGWEMPVQYSSIVEEHLCVRRAAGIFDISHMGEVRFDGPACAAFLNWLLINEVHKLSVGLGQYTLMCQPNGGVVDDLYVFRIGAESFYLVINASRIESDLAWMQTQLEAYAQKDQVKLVNLSETTAAVAVQGPRVAEFINACFSGPAAAGMPVSQATDLKKNQIAQLLFQEIPVWVSRTGYTGEDGFEIMAPASLIEAIWDRLLAVGQPQGLQPAGLGARDTLRTESCYPLYGHELDENTTPVEAGLSFFIGFDKGPFIGREVLASQKANGVAKRCIAFKMLDKSPPPRPGYHLLADAEKREMVGQVVSGTLSPSLGIGIGLAYVPPALANPGTILWVEIRNACYRAEVVKKPIYRAK